MNPIKPSILINNPFIKDDSFLDKMNYWGAAGVPFIFILDFECSDTLVLPLDMAAKHDILFDIKGFKNFEYSKNYWLNIDLVKKPVSYETYLKAFHLVKENEVLGNSYLVNLTFPTEVEVNLSLQDIFFVSQAPYKLFFQNKFVVFSPETFVIMKDNRIFSYPMKGTIDASLPGAYKKILVDPKESAEHITIVDLIRNDLSMISNKVKVEKYRYVDKIYTNGKNLFQVSSKISGELVGNYQKKIGNYFASVLPAGSVTGAPKKKTLEIIKNAETYSRGYYTGVFGIFNGEYLDSAVMIRFIEKDNDKMVFKSGGGITIYSDPEKEYNEMIDKVYVPVNRSNTH